MGLIPQFGSVALTLLAFVAALSIIVAIHEYGHYIVARWTGIHAEVFSLGFGPVLISTVDRRGTRWQIAALPLGGYVKFLGDTNAASGKDAAAVAAMEATERRRSMHGAPLWARAATVAAGPAFNFVFSILVFGLFALFAGREAAEIRVNTPADLPATFAVLESGDLILAIDGIAVETPSDLIETAATLPPAPTARYTIERDDRRIEVAAAFPLVPVIQSVTPGSAALDAGLRAGDVIQAIDGTPMHAFHQIRTTVDASAGTALRLTIWREGEVFDTTLSPRRTDSPTDTGGFETRYLIGITGGLSFDLVRETISPFAALWAGVQQTGFIIESSLSGLWHIITGAISSCNLQGPIGIAETSGAAASQGVETFLWFIAVLSTAVGLLNLFPIPMLDGGHLVFHAYEAVSGTPPSDRVMQVFMTLGLTLVLSIMVFALTNDIFCP